MGFRRITIDLLLPISLKFLYTKYAIFTILQNCCSLEGSFIIKREN